MATNEDKDKIISEIYFDPSGYGSVKNTYTDARMKDRRITLKYVQNWFSETLEATKQPGGTNSFVAQEAYYEYQVDLFFINDLEDQKFIIGMVCIDIFSKFAAVVPLASKKTGDVAAGILESIKLMGRKPKMIYTDDEAALSSIALSEFFVEQKIKHYVTRKHAAFAERMIRTFKAALYKRIDNKGNPKKKNPPEGGGADPQWHELIYQIMLTYNNKLVHSSTKKTPEQARQGNHQMDVKANLEIRAMKNRKYPALAIGDSVKIMRKKKVGEKERTSIWSIEVFKVTAISEEHGQDYYTTDGADRSYTRAEVLKV